MTKSKYTWKICWCHHKRSCTTGNGSLRNKTSNGFKRFYYYLNQLRTIGRLAAFRVELNLLRVRSNWHAGKNAVSLRLIRALSFLLDSRYFCTASPSSLISLSRAHVRTQTGLRLVLCVLLLLEGKFSLPVMYQTRVGLEEREGVWIRNCHTSCTKPSSICPQKQNVPFCLLFTVSQNWKLLEKANGY